MAVHEKNLLFLLEGLTYEHLSGTKDAIINIVVTDSRAVKEGALFIARQGDVTDGHKYMPQAVQSGASAVLCEIAPKVPFARDIPIYKISNPRRNAGVIAARLYDFPAKNLTIHGVTGTNGKTTTTYVSAEIMRANGALAGIIGTTGYHTAQGILPALHTTPEGETLQELFSSMVEHKISYVSMEASSHALKQGRIAGVLFDAVAFTNLTRDHLDFHGTLEDYYQSKRLLFSDYLKPHGAAVINIDDEYGQRLASELAIRKLTISLQKTSNADIRPLKYNISISGITATLITPRGEITIQSPLVGSFNLMNVITALGLALIAGVPFDAIAEGIARSEGAPGRLERIFDPRGSACFVDYAHTPDALWRVTGELRKLTQGKLIVLCGAGGDRDKGKRPLMGKEAARYADVVIVTSDNPRSENPTDIISQIVPGVEEMGFSRKSENELKTEHGYIAIENRRDAIRFAMKLASQNDTVLVSGKGHEDYQEIKGVRYPFSDKLELKKAIAELTGEKNK